MKNFMVILIAVKNTAIGFILNSFFTILFDMYKSVNGEYNADIENAFYCVLGLYIIIASVFETLKLNNSDDKN